MKLRKRLNSSMRRESNNPQCDVVDPLKFPFEPERYMGIWYQILINNRDYLLYPADAFDCVIKEYYNYDANEKSFRNISSVQVGGFPRFGFPFKCSLDGTPNGQAELTLFGLSPPSPLNYYILDTDYDTYSMLYYCEDGMRAVLYILSRELTLD